MDIPKKRRRLIVSILCGVVLALLPGLLVGAWLYRRAEATEYLEQAKANMSANMTPEVTIPLLERSAKLGNTEAKLHLAKELLLRDQTDSTLARIESLVVQTSSLPHSKTSRMLLSAAVSYEKGNYDEAFDYLYSAKDTKSIRIYFCLGYCFENGIGTDKNLKKALSWYYLAAVKSKAHYSAYVHAGYIAELILPAGDSTAYSLYRTAIILHDSPEFYARYSILELIATTSESSGGAAIYHLEKAAQKKSPLGKLFFGICLLSGYRIERDIPRGMKLLEASYRHGEITQEEFDLLRKLGSGKAPSKEVIKRMITSLYDCKKCRQPAEFAKSDNIPFYLRASNYGR